MMMMMIIIIIIIVVVVVIIIMLFDIKDNYYNKLKNITCDSIMITVAIHTWKPTHPSIP